MLFMFFLPCFLWLSWSSMDLLMLLYFAPTLITNLPPFANAFTLYFFFYFYNLTEILPSLFCCNCWMVLLERLLCAQWEHVRVRCSWLVKPLLCSTSGTMGIFLKKCRVPWILFILLLYIQISRNGALSSDGMLTFLSSFTPPHILYFLHSWFMGIVGLLMEFLSHT